MSSRGGGSADAFAEIARSLLAQGDVQHTLQKICDLAVETIDGCDHAGISFLKGKKVETPAASDDVPRKVDAHPVRGRRRPVPRRHPGARGVRDRRPGTGAPLAALRRPRSAGDRHHQHAVLPAVRGGRHARRPQPPVEGGERLRRGVTNGGAGVRRPRRSGALDRHPRRADGGGAAVPRSDRPGQGHPDGPGRHHRRPGVRHAAAGVPAAERQAARRRRLDRAPLSASHSTAPAGGEGDQGGA